MKKVIASLESISPYSQSRFYEVPKVDNGRESSADYEARTWQHRLHTMPDGTVFIPPMAFKNCLSDAAKYMSVQIPGKGKSTYTKHIEAGVLVYEPVILPLKGSDVPGEWLFVPASGKRGDGKRVKKCFPRIDAWKGDVSFNILDEIITEDVFRQHLEAAGNFIGVGRFRPRNNGFYGRFKVTALKWDV